LNAASTVPATDDFADMSLTAGARLGPYEILAPLGAGGMGEVYRARDTRLDRLVAVKVLSSHLSADPQLRQRFEREARAISSLNHPNICALYDVGEVATPEPIHFLVMELVDGESLSERLTRGPLPLDEALQRGIEIVDALSNAHRRGIIHRDVKPANVMLTKTGAKLLDFGLAKSGFAVGSAGRQGETTLATTPLDLTMQGTILGTFEYMAPEQLEGLDVDARTDIFAFGTMLFEMITGRKPFVARTQASLIGAILRDQPPALSSVVAVTPPALDRVIGKCLAKNPDDRWQDASDLRDELRWIADGGGPAGTPLSTPATRQRRESVAWALFAIALAGIGMLAMPYWRQTPPLPVVRFTLPPPEGVMFAPAGAPVAPFPAISPDGTRLVFVANRTGEAASLWLRSLDSPDARPLNDTIVRTDTLSPALPFWSPDSRSIGFFADGKLKRIDVDGAPPQTICDARQSGGASWGANGTIVFASKIDEGLRKVAANGGVPVQITTPDTAHGEISHSNPAFLPDGRHFLYWVQAPKSSIHVGSVDSSETKHLFESDSRAAYASGYVFFVRQSRLIAQPFDTGRLETSGEPVLVADDVRTFPLNGRSAFSASANGILVYRTGSVRAGRTLAWHDRLGKQLAIIPDSTATYTGMSLASDDRHVITQIEEGNGSDLWLIDLEQATRSRITSDPKSEGSPVLSPDGRLVAFASDRYGVDDIFRRRADGVGDEQVLVRSSTRKYPTDWSNHWITFTAIDSTRKQDLWVLEPDGEPKPYLQTEFGERDGHLSPDERWMIYVSDEAGRDAIYIRPFPNANGGKWRVSGAGASGAPRWRADGKEIFYADDGGRIMAVPVNLSGLSPVVGLPQMLFRVGGLTRAQYEVSRDGTRFLMSVRSEGSQSDVPLSVVLNWPSLLQRK
jgi:serine/threonine protein kinase/Tol biopolymer transport system component